jgi:hypothetical protein
VCDSDRNLFSNLLLQILTSFSRCAHPTDNLCLLLNSPLASILGLCRQSCRRQHMDPCLMMVDDLQSNLFLPSLYHDPHGWMHHGWQHPTSIAIVSTHQIKTVLPHICMRSNLSVECRNKRTSVPIKELSITIPGSVQ